MSILPFFLGHSLDFDPCKCKRHYPGLYQHSPPWDQFGLDIAPAEIHLLAEKNELPIKGNQKKIQPLIGKNGLQVHMNVQKFEPKEISVKTIDGFVVIEGKHEDREDEHGHLSRQFVRKYKLPEGYDADQVFSTLSSDGVLTVKAPPPGKSLGHKEKVIQIHQTGPAHLNIKIDKIEENVDPETEKKNKK